MKIFISEIDMKRLNYETSGGKYSLNQDGGFTQAVELKYLGELYQCEIFAYEETAKIFILDGEARTFRQIDGWAEKE